MSNQIDLLYKDKPLTPVSVASHMRDCLLDQIKQNLICNVVHKYFPDKTQMEMPELIINLQETERLKVSLGGGGIEFYWLDDKKILRIPPAFTKIDELTGDLK